MKYQSFLWQNLQPHLNFHKMLDSDTDPWWSRKPDIHKDKTDTSIRLETYCYIFSMTVVETPFSNVSKESVTNARTHKREKKSLPICWILTSPEILSVDLSNEGHGCLVRRRQRRQWDQRCLNLLHVQSLIFREHTIYSPVISSYPFRITCLKSGFV